MVDVGCVEQPQASWEERSMKHYAGLDVSVKETSICIVDEAGRICREMKVVSHPEDLLAVLCDPAWRLERVGLEAGPLKDKIAALKAQMQAFKAMEAEVHAAPDQQISLTDPDARAMGTSGKGTAIVGYNVQTAVDAQHHLIVAHDVTNVGHDRDQLSNMAGQATAAMGVEALDVLADRGYFKGEEVLACEPLGVTPYVPKPLTSGSKAAGRFGKQDFVYIPEEDAYRCPADQRLTWRFTSAEKGMTLHSYWTSKCTECPLKTQGTAGKGGPDQRREAAAVIRPLEDRLDRAPKSMRVRRATVEHPFGTLKAWMGATHFKTRTLERVRTEMSLHVLAYNLKRVIAILGAQPLMEAMRA